MSALGLLQLRYGHAGGHTRAADRHEGPLRVLKAAWPEGPAVCHHVLVHPPGGLVGGDRLAVEVDLEADAHAVVTTAGATRIYRSGGPAVVQQLSVRQAAGSRLEWLPLETIAHAGCLAENSFAFDLADAAESIGWDLLALGLPAADAPFDRGELRQHIELRGRWLERARIAAGDTALLDGPLGLAGHRVLATLWFAAGSPLPAARRDALLDAARAAADASLAQGATAPNDHVVVLRVLAHRVEPALRQLVAVRAAWRRLAWGLEATTPRIWRT
jgi:urease accessory protein